MAAGESQQMLAGESERLLAGRDRVFSRIGPGGRGARGRRAVREAQLAARVRHPNVVGVYDIVQEDDRPSIVMELVPFRSLRDAVAEAGPMTPAAAARGGPR